MKTQEHSASSSELRKFGLLFSAIIIVLFGVLLPLLHHRSPPMWPFYVGGPIGALALLWPAALRPLYKAWMRFGAVMGFINTYIIMSLLFFLVLTPIGWLMRLSHKDPLFRSFSKQPSYRVASRPRAEKDLEKPY